jgi:tetratricopeptide (TPR) repeat protein
MYPNSLSALNNLANAYSQEAGYKTAVDHHWATLSKTGGISTVSGDDLFYIDQAASLYQKILLLSPANTHALNNLAIVYVDLGRAGEAITLLKKILEIDPKDVVAYYNLGKIYSFGGNYQRAMEYYELALEIDPKYSNALMDALDLSIKRQDHEKALFYYKKAKNLGLEVPKTYTEFLENKERRIVK